MNQSDKQWGTLLWHYPFSKSWNTAKSSAVVWDDLIVFPDRSQNLLALDRNSGSTRWSYENATFSATPTIENGVVFVGSGRPQSTPLPWRYSFLALDANTGERIWMRRYSNPICGTALVVEKQVIFGSENGYLRSLSTQDGSLLWEHDLGISIQVAPVYQERIYVGLSNAKLYCIDPQTGEQCWDISLSGSITRPIAHSSNELVVVTTDGEIVSLDCNGDIQWSQKISGRNPSAPTLYKNQIILGAGSPDNHTSGLYRLHRKTGEIIDWFQVEGWARGRPCIAEDTAFLGSTRGLTAINLEQGTRIGSYQPKWDMYSSPTVHQDCVYLITQDGCSALNWKNQSGLVRT